MTREKAAEEVRSAFDAWEYDRCTGDDWAEAHEARDMAVKALTEESIPVEWIRSQMEELRQQDSSLAYYGSLGIEAMLIQWEHEQKNEPGSGGRSE